MKKQQTSRALKRKRLIFIWGMLAYPILQYLIFFIFVNISTVTMSFQQINYGTGTMENFTLQNYERFFYEFAHLDEIRLAIKNSVLAGLNNLVLSFVSVLFGYFFYKKVPGSGVYKVIFFLPSIISIVVYTLCYKYMFNGSFGPINKILSALGVKDREMPLWFGDKNMALPLVFFYCIWVGVGYNILILSGAISKIPEDVMEYAKIDGVGMFKELTLLIIPMIWPTLSVMLIGCVTIIFTFFIQVEMLTGGGPDGSTTTISYMINSKVKGSGANPEWAACLGICFTVIATPLIIIVRKLLNRVSVKLGY